MGDVEAHSGRGGVGGGGKRKKLLQLVSSYAVVINCVCVKIEN